MTQSLEPKYNTTDYYAITIQPEDKIQFLGNEPYNRIIKFRAYYYDILQDIKFPYYINIEISEPLGSLEKGTSGGRLHLHGIIHFQDAKEITQWLLQTQYKLLRQARVEISVIHDKKTWLKYIQKQTLIPEDIKLLTNWDVNIFIKKYLK